MEKYMDEKTLANQWINGLRIFHISHHRAATHFKRLGTIIGLLATVLSALAATTVFLSAFQSDRTTLMIIAGSLSVFTVIFTASHHFLKFGELSERHRQAGASFGELRRELEVLIQPDQKIDKNDPKFMEISAKWENAEKTAPPVPQSIYNRAKNEVLKPE
jgi:hypothetical protein